MPMAETAVTIEFLHLSGIGYLLSDSFLQYMLKRALNPPPVKPKSPHLSPLEAYEKLPPGARSGRGRHSFEHLLQSEYLYAKASKGITCSKKESLHLRLNHP